jgi:hypothetical protein
LKDEDMIWNDDERLTPAELAARLKTSPSTLAKRRMRGDGPTFEKHGRAIRYRWGTARTWAEAQSARHTASS